MNRTKNDYNNNNISFISNNIYNKSNIYNLKRYYSCNNVTHKSLNDNKRKNLYLDNNLKKLDSSEKKK